MNPLHDYLNHQTRRQFFRTSGLALGGMARSGRASRPRSRCSRGCGARVFCRGSTTAWPSPVRAIDQACYGLSTDLKNRGLLDDTLVVWGGEFGRTVYSQGTLTQTDYGRDHHPRCYSMWMAGGGVKTGRTYGETDDFSYNIVRDPVSLFDLNATLLHCLGIDHDKFSYKFQGLDQKLTGVEEAKVVKGLLA